MNSFKNPRSLSNPKYLNGSVYHLVVFFSVRTGGKVSLQGNMDPCALYATKVRTRTSKQHKPNQFSASLQFSLGFTEVLCA